jgi:hypothetical protein
LLLVLLGAPRGGFGQELITALSSLSLSATTGEKPQSKLWQHDGRWWAVLPSTAVSPSGTWLWRLGGDNRWTNVLRLSSSTSTHADTLQLGHITHVLLYSSAPQLISLEYAPAQQTYVLWPDRPTPTPVSLSSSETATIDVDSTGRMWLAADSGSKVVVYHSAHPYSAFAGPISLATNTTSDDIAVVTALPFPPPGRIGVLWSNQGTDRFGFRVHLDGDAPGTWGADERPAEQSALRVGNGFADDHLNVKVGSDGTLYAAVKTSYDTKGFAKIALLVRRPDGRWDDAHYVDDSGTRGIVLLNEPAQLLRVVYAAEGGGNIYYRDSLLDPIHFGSRGTLISGSLNDPTSTRMSWTDEVVVVASGRGVRISRADTGTTTTATATTSTSTTTTLAGSVRTVEVRVAASADDAEETSGGSMRLTSSDLELTEDGGAQTVGMRFRAVAIPRAARIARAWVQFQVDEATSGATSLQIAGQASDDALAFTTASRNLSARPRTTASVSWAPAAWPTVGAATTAQRTPDLAAILQQIVDRPGWASGHALVVVVTGTGKRVAESYDGASRAAPLLHVEFTSS